MRNFMSAVALGVMVTFGLSGSALAKGEAERDERAAIEEQEELEPVAGEEMQTIEIEQLDEQQVRSIQNRLQQMGYYEGPVDGQLNEPTKTGLRAFLADRFVKEHGKLEDGELSAHRAQELGVRHEEIQPVRGEEEQELPAEPREQEVEPMAGEEQLGPQQIREIQQVLTEQGYYTGPVDGIMGPQTREAVRQFQQAEDLEASGRLDQETLDELGVDVEQQQQQQQQRPQQQQQQPGFEEQPQDWGNEY